MRKIFIIKISVLFFFSFFICADITTASINKPTCEQLKTFPLTKMNRIIRTHKYDPILKEYFGIPLPEWSDEDFETFVSVFIDCKEKADNFFKNYTKEYFPPYVEKAATLLKKEYDSLRREKIANEKAKKLKEEADELIKQTEALTITESDLARLKELMDEADEAHNLYSKYGIYNFGSIYKDIDIAFKKYKKSKVSQEGLIKARKLKEEADELIKQTEALTITESDLARLKEIVDEASKVRSAYWVKYPEVDTECSNIKTSIRLALEQYKLKKEKIAFNKILISPFGSLEWNDGISDVVNKLNERNGIEKVELVAGKGRINLIGINGNGLNKVLTSVLENKYGYILNANDHRSDTLLESYIDKKGAEQKYLERVMFHIEASPVIMSNVPFKIIVNFTNAVGMAIEHSEKVITENKWDIAFPLTLASVGVFSDSPSLADNYRKIDNSIEKKYRELDPNQNWMFSQGDYLHVDMSDSNGTRLRLTESTPALKYNLVYSRSDKDIEYLAEVYRQHLANIENKKTKDKQDMSSDL